MARALVALLAGLVGAAVGGLVVAAADGGPSTGYGIVGGLVAALARVRAEDDGPGRRLPRRLR